MLATERLLEIEAAVGQGVQRMISGEGEPPPPLF